MKYLYFSKLLGCWRQLRHECQLRRAANFFRLNQNDEAPHQWLTRKISIKQQSRDIRKKNYTACLLNPRKCRQRPHFAVTDNLCILQCILTAKCTLETFPSFWSFKRWWLTLERAPPRSFKARSSIKHHQPVIWFKINEMPYWIHSIHDVISGSWLLQALENLSNV